MAVWHPVADKPPSSVWYLVVREDTYERIPMVDMAFYYKEKNAWATKTGFSTIGVVCWTELPDPPDELKGGD